MSGLRVALEQPERVLQGVVEWPVEIEPVAPRSTRENDTGLNGSSAAASALGELAAKVDECHGLPPRKLPQAGVERDQCLAVGQDLSRLLERLRVLDSHGAKAYSPAA